MTPEALAALHARANDRDRAWGAAEFAGLLASPGAILLGDARAVLLLRVVASEAEVLTLATDPAHRRRGLARALLAAFEARAMDAGAVRAVLEVAEDNEAARALYEGAGYAAVGRRPAYYARTGAPAAAALVLARDLPGWIAEISVDRPRGAWPYRRHHPAPRAGRDGASALEPGAPNKTGRPHDAHHPPRHRRHAGVG